MSFVTLEEAKDHLSVHQSITIHDDRLRRIISAAEATAKNFLNVDALEDVAADSPAVSPIELPEDVKTAILFYIEMEFDRDEKVFELLQKRAEALLWPYRQGLGV